MATFRQQRERLAPTSQHQQTDTSKLTLLLWAGVLVKSMPTIEEEVNK